MTNENEAKVTAKKQTRKKASMVQEQLLSTTEAAEILGLLPVIPAITFLGVGPIKGAE